MSPVPHDDDDITTPARPAGAKSAAAVPRPAVPSALKWGVVGSLHRVEPLTRLPGQTGVVRLLPNNIAYTPPPDVMTWSPVKAEPGRFEMAWPGNVAAAESLEDLGATLRKLKAAQGELPANHPACAELDAAVDALLTVAEKLNRQGWGVGLLTPAGVMLNGGEVVPVDLGFTWTGEFGDPPWDDSPGRPPWLSPDEVENPAARVWDRPPVEQQFALGAKSPFKKPAPDADVRTLARVVQWVLIGQPSPAIRGSSAAVWGVLRAAMSGDIESARELREQLRESPPSGHFAAPPEVALTAVGELPPRRSSSKLAVAVGLATLLVAAGVGYFLFVRKPPEVVTGPTATQPTDPGTTQPTNNGPPAPPGDGKKHLDDFNKLPDLAGRLAKFPEVAKGAKGDPDLEKLVGAAREKLFADWVVGCEQQVTAATNAGRGEGGAELRKLVDKYAAIHKDHPPADPAQKDKELQWLEQYDRHAELLGWPR